jgi:hypothetical protein
LTRENRRFEYFEGQCEAAFGVGYGTADVAAFNAVYQGLAPNSTQVFAANGGDDPWRGCTAFEDINPT